MITFATLFFLFIIAMTFHKTALDKELSDKVSFISFIIPRFAGTYKMNIQNAYFYLKEHVGLDYLFDCWWALHTDNDIWAVHDIYNYCYRSGGEK
jgi:hypothetical protein